MTEPSVATPDASVRRRGMWWEVPVVVAAALGLTYLFFSVLWHGGGLVGGDIYTYFYPQQQFLGESLRRGEIPLWNNRTGHGYPIVGESQTGVFYPFHFLYGVLELNAAYNAIQLTHYVIACLGCWLLARRWGLSPCAAGLATVVYVFGWLPVRLCVEWAALGAAWLPWVLWLAETYLQTKQRRCLFGITLLLTLQMLAGHFHLAFITQLTLLGYVGLSLAVQQKQPQADLVAGTSGSLLLMLLAVGCAFGCAAIQLGPTWELKSHSQRAALGDEHDPQFGYIPWWYLGQLVAPWSYYDGSVNLGATPPGAPRTNSVEAHLYCGLIPLCLILAGLIFRRQFRDRRTLVWWILGMGGLIYATGVLMPAMKHLPGFGFFNGVGRYGIVVNLAMGMLAGESLQRLERGLRWSWVVSLGTLVIAATIWDLWMVSQMVRHTVAIPRPPLKYLADSPLRQALSETDQPVRLFCRGANLPNLLGVASTPVYLGLGPDAYFDARLTMPQPLPFDTDPSAEQLAWLRRGGVTHVLSFTSLNQDAWQARLVLASPDLFLNRAWARSAQDAFYLYELQDAPGRIYWATPQPSASASIVSYRANQVVVRTEASQAGDLVLTDLEWPGWTVRIDGQPVTTRTESAGNWAPYRVVYVPAGQHTVEWLYRPPALFWGAIVSICTLVTWPCALWWTSRRARRPAFTAAS